MSDDLTEAETRVVYIDRLLRDCNWDIEELIKSRVLKLEPQEDRRVLDYLFSEHVDSDVKTIVIEAKRTGVNFRITDKNLPDFKHKNTKKAIDQAHEYATKMGIPWFVVSNGKQWFVYKTFTPHKQLSDLCLLTVRSDDDERNLTVLKNLLRIDDNKYHLINDRLTILMRNQFRVQDTIEKITSLLKEHYEKLKDNITVLESTEEKVIQSGVSMNVYFHKIRMRLLQKLIFVKSIEYWGIEPNRLSDDYKAVFKDLIEETPSWNLIDLTFKKINKRYNGPLFVDDELFDHGYEIKEEYIEELIDEFSKLNYQNLTEDILGDIYEHFLAEIVKFSTTDENERKLKGQYYTPSYVVDHIVRETLIPFLSSFNGDLRKIKILDPACGSGSFLIKVYNVLKTEYARRKSIAIGEWKTKDGSLFVERIKVEFDEKIAREYDPVNDPIKYNIFGIDIVPEAVDLTKMNLMFHKLIGDKSLYGAYQNLDFLPSESQRMFLLENIKNNDSLITDWNVLFGFSSFDIIIGNPPYVEYNNLPNDYRDILTPLFSYQYQRYDLYLLFVEKCLFNLRESGSFSFIIPGSLLDEQNAIKIRELILKEFSLQFLVDLRDYKVFPEATIDTIIFHIVKKEQTSEVKINKPLEDPRDNQILMLSAFALNVSNFSQLKDLSWRLISNEDWELYKKMNENSIKLSDVCYITNGIQISPLSSFESRVPKTVNGLVTKPYLKGKQITQYYISDKGGTYFLYTDDKDYYLQLQKEGWDFADDPKSWKAKFSELLINPKIVIPRIAGKNIKGAFDPEERIIHQTVLIVIQKDYIKDVERKKFGKSAPSLSEEELLLSKSYNIKYLLGVINSGTILGYFNKFLGNGLDVLKHNVENFPVPRINDAEQTEVIDLVNILEITSMQFNVINERFSDELHKYQVSEFSISRLIKSYRDARNYGIVYNETKIVKSESNKKFYDVEIHDDTTLILDILNDKKIILKLIDETITWFYYLSICAYLDDKKEDLKILDKDFAILKVVKLPRTNRITSIHQIMNNLFDWFKDEISGTGKFKDSPIKTFNMKELSSEISTTKKKIDDILIKHYNIEDYEDLFR
ncbi:hypothetical protein CEE45_05810 [Candidatus Heimdallarchaeota archaeon B3_Heim]|nr:MAG: hypothetical protein CEE45_05810 [Candidatus Heimdallarchaeota archaeon B3_Heim]